MGIVDVLKGRLLKAAPVADVEATLVLRVAGCRPHTLTVALERGAVTITSGLSGGCPDATFLFDSETAALGVLGGEADPIEMFMQGRFRADGNLPLAFVLLGLFRPEYRGGPPP